MEEALLDSQRRYATLRNAAETQRPGADTELQDRLVLANERAAAAESAEESAQAASKASTERETAATARAETAERSLTQLQKMKAEHKPMAWPASPKRKQDSNAEKQEKEQVLAQPCCIMLSQLMDAKLKSIETITFPEIGPASMK